MGETLKKEVFVALRKIFKNLIWALFLATTASASSGEDILLIGDSQSFGSFGSEFVKQGRARGWKVSAYARPGASALWYWRGNSEPNNWGSWDDLQDLSETRSSQAISTPLLRELIQKHSPAWVVVQLGGNMSSSPHELVREQTEGLAQVIAEASRRCLWLGPPPGDRRPPAQEFEAFYQVLKKSAESKGCLFVDTRKMIEPAPRGGDGIHLDSMGVEGEGVRAARQWAQKVIRKIAVLRL
jgi:hypothetical protein